MVPNGGWEWVAARKHRTAEQMIEHQRHDWAGFPPPQPVEVDEEPPPLVVVTFVTICCRTLGSNLDRFDFPLLFLRSLIPPSSHSKLASLPPLLPQPLSCAVNGPLYPPSLLLSMATAGVMISSWLNFFPVETRTAVALAIVDRVVDRIRVKLDVALVCTAARLLPLPPTLPLPPPPLPKLLPPLLPPTPPPPPPATTAERMLLF